MSRWRLEAKLRTNQEYKTLTAWLDANGFKWAIEKNNLRGHPDLAVTLPDGRTIRQTIACTPRGGVNATARLARLKRRLRNEGATV